jgi:UDP:flavonoid glycosyltransferase YjiC (YdhE family)
MALKILVIPDAISLAHVSRALQIARAARERGHAVRVASAEPYEELFLQAGFEVERVFSVPQSVALKAIRRGGILYTDEILRQYVESDIAALTRSDTDVVVGDLRLSLDISSELTGVPYVSVLNAYWTRHCAVPVALPETVPLLRYLGRKTAGKVLQVVQPLVLRRLAGVFNRFRRAHGLAARGNIFDVMASPYLTLLADLPEFVPSRDLPAQFHYIGPILWEPEVPEPDWLGDVAADVPTVYLTMGSTGQPEVFVRVLRDLAEAGLQVMVTTCDQISSDDLPPGCFVTRLARASALLAKASVTVCHGGNGTIYQSLSHGVPVVGVPTFHDQEFNMERVEALGLGVRVRERSLRAGDIVAAVQHILANADYARRAADLQRQVVGSAAPEAALWHIERRALEGQPPPSTESRSFSHEHAVSHA